MTLIKDRYGKTQHVEDDYVLRDGESFTTPMMMMDGAPATALDAYEAWVARNENAWKKQGD